MRHHFLVSIITGAVAVAGVGLVISVCLTPARSQSPEASAIAAASTPRTPWGEPDLQGIWTDEFDTPFQRPAKYANQEYFTEAQREELDKARTELLSRRAVGNHDDAYNFAVFFTIKRTGCARRRSSIRPTAGFRR